MVILDSGRSSRGAASGISIPDSGNADELMAECLEKCLLAPNDA